MDNISVTIFVQPTAYCDSSKSWHAAMKMIETRIQEKTEFHIQFNLIELFSQESFLHPHVYELLQKKQAEPPLVFVNNTLVQIGGKLSERLIREGIEQVARKLQTTKV